MGFEQDKQKKWSKSIYVRFIGFSCHTGIHIIEYTSLHCIAAIFLFSLNSQTPPVNNSYKLYIDSNITKEKFCSYELMVDESI